MSTHYHNPFGSEYSNIGITKGIDLRKSKNSKDCIVVWFMVLANPMQFICWKILHLMIVVLYNEISISNRVCNYCNNLIKTKKLKRMYQESILCWINEKDWRKSRKKYLMVDDYLLHKEIDRIKMIIGIKKFPNNKTLIGTDD